MRSIILVLILIWSQSNAAPSLQCTQDIASYIAGITPLNPKLWALKMLDSSSKFPPDGIMQGSFIIQMGNFDECISTKGPIDDDGVPRFRGKYCRVQLGFKAKNENDPKTELLLAQMQIAHDNIQREIDLLNNVNYMQSAALNSKAAIYPSNGTGITAQWAVCAPSSCNADGVQRVADFNLGLFFSALNLNVSTTVLENSCYSEDLPKEPDTGEWIFIIFTVCLCTVMAFSTVLDYIQPEEKEMAVVVKAFSVRFNMKELFTLPKKAYPGQLTCLNGIRVISTWWVILLHCYMINAFLPHINIVQALDTYPYMWSMAPILSGALSVDTFFLLSGLLTAYIPLIDQRKGRPFSILKYYIYRYLRITLPLAMLVFYLSTVHDRTGKGPLWDLYIEIQTDRCEKNWWATLVYIANYYKPPETSCVSQAWYLMVDMQLSLLAPIVIYPLLLWPKIGLALTGILSLGSMAMTFAYTYIYKFPWTLMYSTAASEATENFTIFIYSNTPIRAVPYLFGMFLAYILANKITVKLPKWAVILDWLINTVLCLTLVFVIIIPYAREYDYDELGSAFFASFHRLGWSIGVGWVIWACVNGYAGPVNAILSWKYFVPLSKLSFCAYLVHLDLMYYHVAVMRTNTYFSNFEIVFEFLGNLIMMIPLTLFLYLAVDAPAQTILRSLFGKQNRAATKEKSDDVISDKNLKSIQEHQDTTVTEDEDLEEIKSK